MDLSSNRFSGPIAKEISQCELLTFIDLSWNELSGEISSLITGMRILNYLNLSKNHLVGSIPSWMGEKVEVLEAVLKEAVELVLNLIGDLSVLIMRVVVCFLMLCLGFGDEIELFEWRKTYPLRRKLMYPIGNSVELKHLHGTHYKDNPHKQHCHGLPVCRGDDHIFLLIQSEQVAVGVKFEIIYIYIYIYISIGILWIGLISERPKSFCCSSRYCGHLFLVLKMGNQLQRKHSGVSFEKDHPGCMWGIFHIFDYHQWCNVKKMLPHKRHGGGRHTGGTESPEMNLNVTDTGEAHECMDAEVDHFLTEENMVEPYSTNKKSGKACMKALISEEMSKEEDCKHQISAFPARSLLPQTVSIHHLEPSNHNILDEVSTNVENPRTNLHQNNANTSAIRTWDPPVLKAPEVSVDCNIRCEVCGTTNTVNYLGHNHIDEHRKQLLEMHEFLQEKLDKAKKASLKQKSINGKELIGDVSLHQSKEFLDALEIFSVNKELFLKILQGRDSAPVHHFPSLQASNAKMGLTKLGSFPVADSSGRSDRSSKLKHQQKEIRSLTKCEEKQAGNSVPKLLVSESSEDIYAKSMTLMAGDIVGGILKPDQGSSGVGDNSSLGSPCQLKNQGENQVVIKHFKDIKERIKHAIGKSRKESHRISMDAIFHRIPYGRMLYKDTKKMADQWKETAIDRDDKDSPRSSYESDGSISALHKGGVYSIKRTSSLNESLDRYSQLFESSFRKEAKWHLSERLKLTNGDGVLPGGHAPKSLGRILSLPDLESYCSHQSKVFRDALCSGMPTRTVVDSNANIELCISDKQMQVGLPIIAGNDTQLDALVESESRENLVGASESSLVIEGQAGSVLDINDEENAKLGRAVDDMDDLTMGESTSHQEQNVGTTENDSTKLAQPSPILVLDSCFQDQDVGTLENDSTKLAQPSPISVLDSCFQEYITSPSNSFSEGSELKPRHIHFYELDSLENLQNQSSVDLPTGAGSTLNLEDVEISSKNVESDFLYVQLDRKDKADYNYVRDVLELSGFSGNEYLGTWHSLDQPVDPSVFEEVEGCLPLEPDYSRHEAGGSCDHQLLFDLINEILLEIYERSFTYCPRPLSFNSHIRPLPVGYHVLEEVWASISWYLSSRPELDQSLDYAVARDLAKGDGWMNLQFDTECEGLELEELIFDDLLEEVICS
ncbi:hypothetical protein HHK36_019059 [Tetracentron sinense]|uniref:DUF4378 domain-containing protein n=1 Tax=Tetracentron sinense TaxID=13715 RepID=A0A835D8U0_TETSI|nr:hypothetical protein HHK36_019059 [Tetracentron sinense]